MRRSTLGIIIAVIAALIIIALVAAGRGKDTTTNTANTDNTTATEPTNTTDETTQTPASTAAETDEVEIENNAFTPATIKVKKGTTVTWTNKDSVEHTVTPDQAGSFTGSDMLGQGDTFSVTFDKAGTFTYHCIPHPEMTGTVEVVES